MNILAFDTSAKAASVAVCTESEILSECQIRRQLTHSQTMLPMCEEVFRAAALSFDDIDMLAVSKGPGSFTGIRIGIAAVKGIAFARNLPCFGVSTLEALAENLAGGNGLVCAAMDARRNQVYTALFRVEGDTLTRLSEDAALPISELDEQLKAYGDEKVTLVGDGAKLCMEQFTYPSLGLAPLPLLYGRAASVAFLAAKKIQNGEQPVSAEALMPRYLRLPQAERERLERKQREESQHDSTGM